MDAEFWYKKWEEDRIGFHEREVNPQFMAHFKSLSIEKGSRVFVPLCGKTLDIGWLLSEGYRVAGIELIEGAVQALFAELGTAPQIMEIGVLKHYSAKNIDIFVGDIFNLTREMFGAVDAVYDRAAYVALPERMRTRYAKHLIDITDKAPQLLITYNYDQRLMPGPPFSISDEALIQHYGNTYNILRLASIEIMSELKAEPMPTENVWLLK